MEITLAPIQVLLIEHSEDDTSLIVTALRHESPRFRVHRARSLAQGVAAAGMIDPDVILLGLSLQDASGLDAFQRLFDAHPLIPIVVMTSEENQPVAMESVKLGAQDYIVKQKLESDLLEKVIHYAIERQRILRQLTLENDKNRALSRSLEDKVSLRTRELEEAKSRAEYSARVKTHFLNNITHEIRTPMTCISGSLELIQKNGVPSNMEPFIDIIRESSNRIHHFFESVLDFTIIQSEQIVLQRKSFLLRDVASQLDAYIDTFLKNPSVKYTSRLRNDTVALVGDRHYLVKMVQALLSNAIRYTAAGTITVEISDQIDPKSARCGLEFSVGNTGYPIDPAVESQLFEPFFQVEGAKTATYSGAGVGLSIAQAIANKMEGTVRFYRDPERGNVFVIGVVVETRSETR